MIAAQRPRPVWLLVIAASLPMFMASLDNLVVTTALPAIMTSLDASLEELTWTVNAYTLTFASLILMASALADRFGRRRVFLSGLVVFTVASLGCGLSTSSGMLIASRVLQGAGGAALTPLSLALLVTSVPERLRPMATGIWGGISGAGIALGPIVGGAIVEGLAWEAIFWLNVPIGVVAFLLITLVLPESYGQRKEFDVFGLVLAIVGVFALVFGVVRAGELGWSNLFVLGMLVSGVVFLGGFVAWELRVRRPLMPLRLFRMRSFAVANTVGVVFMFGVFGTVFLLVQFLQLVQGVSPLQAGIMTMPWTMAPIVMAPVSGLLVPKIGARPLIITGLTFLAVSLTVIALRLAPALAYRELVVALLIAGVGMGLVFSPLSTVIMDGIDPDDAAMASGMNSTTRQIGVALGVAVLSAVFIAAGGSLTPSGFVEGIRPAILVGAGSMAVAAVGAVALPSRRVAVSSS